jgi:hypothetical protein
MLSLPPRVRIFVAREPTDMRKGFDSLAPLVRSHLGAIRYRASSSFFAPSAAIDSRCSIGIPTGFVFFTSAWRSGASPCRTGRRCRWHC